MKTTNKTTAHILIKATTNSEWDNCEFAIVHLSKEWKKEQARRLEAVNPFAEDFNFQSLNYYDTAVNFYRIDDNDQPDIEKILAGKEWVFVELNEEEQETFSIPENRLDGYSLVVNRNGSALYKAYGKHTGEEFWTEKFSLQQLIDQL